MGSMTIAALLLIVSANAIGYGFVHFFVFKKKESKVNKLSILGQYAMGALCGALVALLLGSFLFSETSMSVFETFLAVIGMSLLGTIMTGGLLLVVYIIPVLPGLFFALFEARYHR